MPMNAIAMKNASVQPAIDRPRNTHAFSAHSPLPSSTRRITSTNGIDSSMYDSPMPHAGTWSFGSDCSHTWRVASAAPKPEAISSSSA